jgi:hypothetical protein
MGALSLRLALAVAVTVVAATAGIGGAAAEHAGKSRVTTAGPIPGVEGNPARFAALTGQKPLVVEAFLAWGQGQSFGSPFSALIPTLAPIPMIHLGTAGRTGKEAITPGAIAAGRGDAYLIALDKAIAAWGKGIYVFPMAEMNNPGSLWAGYSINGAPRDAAHSPASYRKAFARIFLILHGGAVAQVNAKLRALGLPPVAGALVANPFPRLRVVWAPLAGGRPNVPGNAPAMYYPGTAYVDVDGADIYDEALTDTAPWSALEAIYRLALSHHKPFSLPEWGLIDVDDAAFVKHMCAFLTSHRATEMQAFFNGRPGSRLDLAGKPKSKAAFRQCITPLAGPMPGWAG